MGDVIKDISVSEIPDDKSRDPDADTDVTSTSGGSENGEILRCSSRKDSTSPVEKFEHPFSYSNDTSDLRLLVEGRPLYVSRVVLSLVSPVLKRYEHVISRNLSYNKTNVKFT